MFKFRLQRVLELREENEQEKARLLANAEAVAEQARANRDELVRMREESRTELLAAQTGHSRVGQLQQLNIVVVALEQRILLANDAVANAEKLVVDARHAVELAARDRQVLDRLKEKHAQVWRMEELHADRQHMDEIALSRFGRNRESKASADRLSQNNSLPTPDDSTVEGNPT
jgi:flagellar FliJ protein